MMNVLGHQVVPTRLGEVECALHSVTNALGTVPGPSSDPNVGTGRGEAEEVETEAVVAPTG